MAQAIIADKKGLALKVPGTYMHAGKLKKLLVHARSFGYLFVVD